jgi:hypothetical protein
MSDWYVVGPDRKPYGPYSIAKLKEYVADGRVTRTTFVIRRGSSKWERAATVEGLFLPPQSGPSEAPPLDPPQEPDAPREPATPALPCPTCHTGRLQRASPYRLSTPAVIIGYCLLVLSVIVALPSFFMLVGGLLNLATVGRIPQTGPSMLSPEAQVQIAAAGIWSNQVVPALNALLIALTMLVVGVLLVMVKSVLRCNRCGMSIPAS